MIQRLSRPCIHLLRGLFPVLLIAFSHGAWALVLEDSERQWLEQHPVIRVSADPAAPPFEWIDKDGAYKGISAEILAKIEKQLGVRFEIKPARDWADALKKLQDREADMLTAVAYSNARTTYLGFTQPYLELPGVIISGQEFKRLEDLEGHKVAVVSGGIWDERISRYDDKISIIRVEDTRTALDLTALGGVDAMISNMATVSYHIGQEGYTNLHIAGRLKDDELKLSLGIRNDWPELLSILEKALAEIPPKDIKAITDKWTSPDIRGYRVDPMYGYIALGLAGVMIFILIGVIAWNRALKHRVEKRTRELQLTEQRLAEARKMESIAQLALGIAHEIKNPLSIIQMGIDFLSQDKERDETERAILTDLDLAVRRSEHIVQSLQIVSRQEQVNTASCDINTVIRDTITQFKQQLSEADIKTSLDLDEQISPVAMDRGQLQQALGCLINNARQAMESGGELHIRSQRRRLQATDMQRTSEILFRPGEVVDWIEITDSGKGVQPETFNRIFDPFFSTLAQGEGFGLGLPIAQNIVKLHSGSIDIQNRPGGGVSVVIIFKLKEGETG